MLPLGNLTEIGEYPSLLLMEGKSVILGCVTSIDRHSVWPSRAATCKGVSPPFHFNSSYGRELVDIITQKENAIYSSFIIYKFGY